LAVTRFQKGETQQQDKQDKSHCKNGRYPDASKATRLTIKQRTFTSTHPKHQRTRALIKHEGERFFIRTWSLHSVSEDSKEKGRILHMKVLYILNGSLFPAVKFTSKLRLWGNGIRQMPKSRNCPMQLPWQQKHLELCSGNSDECIQTQAPQVPSVSFWPQSQQPK